MRKIEQKTRKILVAIVATYIVILVVVMLFAPGFGILVPKPLSGS